MSILIILCDGSMTNSNDSFAKQKKRCYFAFLLACIKSKKFCVVPISFFCKAKESDWDNTDGQKNDILIPSKMYLDRRKTQSNKCTIIINDSGCSI